MSTQTKLNDNIRDWYHEEFRGDEIWEDIPQKTTFADVVQTLLNHDDVYETIAADSYVRERVFDKITAILNVDYDDVYETWLASPSIEPSPEMADIQTKAQENLEKAYKQATLNTEQSEIEKMKAYINDLENEVLDLTSELNGVTQDIACIIEHLNGNTELTPDEIDLTTQSFDYNIDEILEATDKVLAEFLETNSSDNKATQTPQDWKTIQEGLNQATNQPNQKSPGESNKENHNQQEL